MHSKNQFPGFKPSIWFAAGMLLLLLATASLRAEGTNYYLDAGQPDPLVLIMPSPLPDSSEQAGDLAKVKGETAALKSSLANDSRHGQVRLILCGMDEVFVINPLVSNATGGVQKLWSWRAKEHSDLPESLRGSFGSTDDCKPAADGKRVLISSSGGGCAVVEYPSGRVLWFARVTNAHSLELLPRERVVCASSVGTKGNRLVLFDLAHSDQPLSEVPLPSAHGVVWDEQRHRLWALGFKELCSYELKDWETDKPTLNLATSYPLPDDDGHDLQAVPGSNDLVVTTDQHVYLFDRELNTFRLHPDLGGKAGVKCVSILPATGRTVFMQSEGGNWWGSMLGFLAPAGDLSLKGEHLYKARWLAAQ